jgi:hypothetical protein
MTAGEDPGFVWPSAEYDETALVDCLEPDQLAAAANAPVPRAQLGARTQVALWMLRVFVIVVGTMVIYTFVSQTIH